MESQNKFNHIAQYYWNLGRLLMDQNEYDQALEMFIKATQSNPIKAEYYEKARDCFILLEDNPNALLYHATAVYIRCQGLIPYENILFMLELFSLGYFDDEYQVQSLTVRDPNDNKQHRTKCLVAHTKRYQFHNKVLKQDKLYRNSKRKFKYNRW